MHLFSGAINSASAKQMEFPELKLAWYIVWWPKLGSCWEGKISSWYDTDHSGQVGQLVGKENIRLCSTTYGSRGSEANPTHYFTND